mgnify:CR=1 FL=1
MLPKVQPVSYNYDKIVIIMTIIAKLVIIVTMQNLSQNCYSRFRHLLPLDLVTSIVTHPFTYLLLLLLSIVTIYLDVLLQYTMQIVTNKADNYDCYNIY